jgi:hypothetical protein
MVQESHRLLVFEYNCRRQGSSGDLAEAAVGNHPPIIANCGCGGLAKRRDGDFAVLS